MYAHLLLSMIVLVVGASPGHVPPHGRNRPGMLHPHATTCTVTMLKMAFGTYAPLGANLSTPLEATGSVRVKCTSGAPYTLTADTGANAANASGSCATATCTRALLTGASSYVSYDLYTTNAYTTVWDTTNGIGGTGTGGNQTVDFFGYIPPGNANTAGTYGDTVGVTVTF